MCLSRCSLVIYEVSKDNINTTYVFFDVLGLHSLIGCIGGIQRPQDEPASGKQRIGHGWE